MPTDTTTAIPSRKGRAATDGDIGRLAADLRLVVGRMARRLRQRSDAGVTASLLSALWTIERAEPVTLGDLATAESVQPPTVTRLVARLEEMDLVRREADAADRRVARVSLTREGHRLLDRTRSLRTAYLTKRLAKATEEDRTTLRRALLILEGLLEEPERP